MEQQTRAFFALEASQKDALSMRHSSQFRGYTRAKEEITRNRPDNREQIDIGAELPAWDAIHQMPRGCIYKAQSVARCNPIARF